MILLLTSLCFIPFSSCLTEQFRGHAQCRNHSGDVVDWWFMIKENRGSRYIYCDSLKAQAHAKNHLPPVPNALNNKFRIDDPETSPLLRTIYGSAPLTEGEWKNKNKKWTGRLNNIRYRDNTVFIAVNDQQPKKGAVSDSEESEPDQDSNERDAFDLAVKSSSGHVKFFTAAQVDYQSPNEDDRKVVAYSYLIQHSLPRFPKTPWDDQNAFVRRNQLPDSKYIFSKNATGKNSRGQHFMCMSFKDKVELTKEPQVLGNLEDYAAAMNQLSYSKSEINSYLQSDKYHFIKILHYLKTTHASVTATNYNPFSLSQAVFHQYLSPYSSWHDKDYEEESNNQARSFVVDSASGDSDHLCPMWPLYRKVGIKAQDEIHVKRDANGNAIVWKKRGKARGSKVEESLDEEDFNESTYQSSSVESDEKEMIKEKNPKELCILRSSQQFKYGSCRQWNIDTPTENPACLASTTLKTTSNQYSIEGLLIMKHGYATIAPYDDLIAPLAVPLEDYLKKVELEQNKTKEEVNLVLVVQSWIDAMTLPEARKTLYDSPSLKVNLTIMNSHGIKLSTEKEAINMPSQNTDHSKWALLYPSGTNGTFPKLFCISDLNRTTKHIDLENRSYKKPMGRGGGTICFSGGPLSEMMYLLRPKISPPARSAEYPALASLYKGFKQSFSTVLSYSTNGKNMYLFNQNELDAKQASVYPYEAVVSQKNPQSQPAIPKIFKTSDQQPKFIALRGNISLPSRIVEACHKKKLPNLTLPTVTFEQPNVYNVGTIFNYHLDGNAEEIKHSNEFDAFIVSPKFWMRLQYSYFISHNGQFIPSQSWLAQMFDLFIHRANEHRMCLRKDGAINRLYHVQCIPKLNVNSAVSDADQEPIKNGILAPLFELALKNGMDPRPKIMLKKNNLGRESSETVSSKSLAIQKENKVANLNSQALHEKSKGKETPKLPAQERKQNLKSKEEAVEEDLETHIFKLASHPTRKTKMLLEFEDEEKEEEEEQAAESTTKANQKTSKFLSKPIPIGEENFFPLIKSSKPDVELRVNGSKDVNAQSIHLEATEAANLKVKSSRSSGMSSLSRATIEKNERSYQPTLISGKPGEKGNKSKQPPSITVLKSKMASTAAPVSSKANVSGTNPSPRPSRSKTPQKDKAISNDDALDQEQEAETPSKLKISQAKTSIKLTKPTIDSTKEIPTEKTFSIKSLPSATRKKYEAALLVAPSDMGKAEALNPDKTVILADLSKPQPTNKTVNSIKMTAGKASSNQSSISTPQKSKESLKPTPGGKENKEPLKSSKTQTASIKETLNQEQSKASLRDLKKTELPRTKLKGSEQGSTAAPKSEPKTASKEQSDIHSTKYFVRDDNKPPKTTRACPPFKKDDYVKSTKKRVTPYGKIVRSFKSKYGENRYTIKIIECEVVKGQIRGKTCTERTYYEDEKDLEKVDIVFDLNDTC